MSAENMLVNSYFDRNVVIPILGGTMQQPQTTRRERSEY